MEQIVKVFFYLYLVCNDDSVCGAGRKCHREMRIFDRHNYYDCEVQGEFRPLLGSNLTGGTSILNS